MTESELIVLRLLGEAKMDLDDPENEGFEEVGLEEPEDEKEEVADEPSDEPEMDEFGMSKSVVGEPGEVDLVQSNIPLVYKLARQWLKKMAAKGANVADVDLAQLVSAGTLALASAAETYDSSVGEFAPLASTLIRNAVSNAGRDYQRQSRATGSKALFSLDQAQTSDDSTRGEASRGDFMPSGEDDPSQEIDKAEGAEAVEQILASLKPAYREVLQGIQDGKTYEEIADEMDVSVARISQVASKAADIVRKRLREKGITGFESGTGRLIHAESLSEAEIRAMLWLLE